MLGQTGVNNMKKQLSIIALTCSALLALISPVKAEKWSWSVGEVYYCESESGTFAKKDSDWEFIRWRPFKFRFKIEGNGDYLKIKFGKGSYFDGFTFDIEKTSYGYPSGYLEASTLGMTFLLIGERFKYVDISGYEVSMMTGTCDKF